MDADTAGLVKRLPSAGTTSMPYKSIYAPAFNAVLAPATQKLKRWGRGATGKQSLA